MFTKPIFYLEKLFINITKSFSKICVKFLKIFPEIVKICKFTEIFLHNFLKIVRQFS